MRTNKFCVISALAIGVGFQASASSIVYLETFPTPAPAPGNNAERVDALKASGWYGGHAGDAFGDIEEASEGRLQADSASPNEPTPVNSNPANGDTPTGRYFFSETTTSNAFFYTDEFSLLTDNLRTISWESDNNFNSNDTANSNTGWFAQGAVSGADQHIALRLDLGATKQWYVSEQGFLQQGGRPADNSGGPVWVLNTVDISTLTWLALLANDGSLLPSVQADGGFSGQPNTNNGQLLAQLLPSGATIDAFGLYTARNAGNIRIDNFSVAAVPLPAAAWMLIAGLGGLAGVARKRRAA